MDERDRLAEEFENERPNLQRIAYRMLGTIGESEDAVQEAWLRLNRTDGASVDNLGGWLTTVVGRVCLDMLRSRKARQETDVAWLPEPIVTPEDEGNPEEQALLADSVGMALMVVLETLNPPERLAFVLHDMFGLPFDEIAPIVDRTPQASRQLASRARRRVRGVQPEPAADPAAARDVIDAFLAAARNADFDRLIAVLDPNVTFRLDAGPLSPLARPPLKGAEAVAGRVLERGRNFASLARPVLVNGLPGLLLERGGRPFAVTSVTVAGNRILEIDIVVDPEKLRHVELG